MSCSTSHSTDSCSTDLQRACVRSAQRVTWVAALATLLVTCTSTVFRFAALTCRQRWWSGRGSLTPGVEFRQGDMMALDAPDAAWAGIAAFYSIIHIPRGDMVRALGELRRVLRPGGLLLLAFHIGDDTIHLDEWWGQTVSVDFFFFRPAEVADCLRAAGFEIEEIIEREPYPDVEHQSRRAYVFARRPKTSV